MEQRLSVQRISNFHWLERRGERNGYRHCLAGRKSKETVKSGYSKEHRWLHSRKQECLPSRVSSCNPRTTECLPLIPQHILTSQKPNWQQQQQSKQQQGSRFRDKQILNLKQVGEILRRMMSGILGGIKACGMIGQRGTKTNGSNLSRNSFFKGSATNDGNVSVTDGEEEKCKHCSVHNGTFPALAHSVTRRDAAPNFDKWNRDAKQKLRILSCFLARFSYTLCRKNDPEIPA